MKCPKCGFNSFDFLEKCKKCGAPTGANPDYRDLYRSQELLHRYDEQNRQSSADTEAEQEAEEQTIDKEPEPESLEETAENLDEELPLDIGPKLSSQDLEIEADALIDFEIETKENEEVESDLASLSARTISLAIDVFVIFLVTAFVFSTGIYVATYDLVSAADYSLDFMAAVFSLLLLIGSSYFIFLEGYGGKTLGNMVMGITVIGDDGDSINVPVAFKRWAVSFFSASFLFIGFLWALFDSRSQTWHDKIAGTIVVKEKT